MYWTKSRGIGGKILTPEDFIVREIPLKDLLRKFFLSKRIEKPSKYHLFLLEKRNTTTERAIKKVANKSGISKNDIGYAGLKDKFAVTSQYITMKNDHNGFEEDGIKITKIGMCNRWLSAGDLAGNEFIITLHELGKPDRLPKLTAEINERCLPNYFGPQRFGIHENNHVIGRLIVKRQFGDALSTVNKMYEKRFEDLRHVPKKKLKFFVHAYQSWIFNETVNEYIKHNIKPCFCDVKIFGFNTAIRNSKMDKILHEILKREGISQGDFKISELRLTCMGSKRKAFIRSEIKYEIIRNHARLSFTLPKGSYATVVLREMCKCNFKVLTQ